MKVEDILVVASEHTNVCVVDYATGTRLSYYDGRNSIDTKYNSADVVSLYVENNELRIVIHSLCRKRTM